MSDDKSKSEIIAGLAEEFVERCRRGEHPAVSEYTKQHPELAEEIREFFAAVAMVEELAPAESDSFGDAGSDMSSGALPALKQLGDFRIIREVGRGGMGVVYEAEQVSLGRHVALKVLPSAALPDDKHVKRFQREAKSAARLHHTNIVPVFGVGAEQELHYYVMQFIRGLPLDEVIDELKKIRAQPSGTITAAPVRVAETVGREMEREYSVTDMARSLMAGQFAQTFIGDSDSDGEAEDAQPNLPQTVTELSPQAGDTSTSKLSETFNLSGSFSGSGVRLGKSGSQSSQAKPFTYWESVANIGLQVADAMQYAHEQGILHRDIKPSNLLLDMRGTAWVTDFGLAKATDQQDITHTGDILGTLRYMPPEAFEGVADARSDVYSLGLTLYELLCFQPAFGMKDRNRLVKQVTTDAAPRLEKLNLEIPRDLVTIVHKAIDRDPSHRYQNARELQEDLQRFLDDEPIRARRISTLERLVRWSRRNRGLAASMSTIAMLVLILAIGSMVAAAHFNQQRLEEQANAEVMSQLAGKNEAARLEEARLRQLAEDESERHRQSLYGADMQLAGRYWADEDGRFDQVDQILAAQVPVDGQVDLRDFSWRLQWSLLHQTSVLSETHDGLPRLAFSNDGRLLSFDASARLRRWHAESGTVSDAVQLIYPGGINHYQLSPDGTSLAIAISHTVRLYETETGSLTHSFETTAPVVSLMYSHDGNKLGAVGTESDVNVWDVQSGLDVTHTRLTPELNMAREGLALAGLSADGLSLAIAHQPDHRKVSVFDLTGDSAPTILRSGPVNVNGLAWSWDGARLATGNGGGVVNVWDTATWERQDSFLADIHAVRALAFSRDGRRLAAGSHIGTVKVFDLENGQVLHTFKGHSNWIESLSFSHDDQWLASGSRDGAMRLWNLSGVSQLQLTAGTWASARVEFSSDGKWLAAGGASTQLWNLEESQSPMRLPCGGWAVTFSPDSRLLAMGDLDSGSIQFWSLDENRILETWDIESSAGALRFSPDGAYLVAGIGTPLMHGRRSGPLRVWDIGKGREVHSAPGHLLSLTDLEFSPDGRTMVTAGHDGELKVWETSDWTQQHVFASGLAPLYCVEFSPDGNVLAAGDAAGRIILWEFESGNVIDVLHGHSNWVIDVAYSADGRTLASTSADRSVRLWNVPSGMPTNVFRLHDAAWITGVAFSPDDSAVVTAGGLVRIWNAPAIEEIERDSNLLRALINRANRAEERGRQHEAMQIRRAVLARCSLAVAAEAEDGSSASDGETMAAGTARTALPPLDRVQLYVQLEQWHDAALAMEEYVQSSPEIDSIDWMRALTLHAVAVVESVGDLSEYERACNAMIEKYRDSSELGDIERTLKCCLLLSAATNLSVMSLDPVREHLASGTLEEWQIPWYHMALALEAYRSGDHSTAVEFAKTGIEAAASTPVEMTRQTQLATIHAISSLAYAAMEDSEQAKVALESARSSITTILHHQPDNSIVGTSVLSGEGVVLHELLIAEILTREATAGIEQ